MRLGELFAGYGGLGLAVEEVFGATTAWFSEFEEGPSKILAHHWPDVPNYGDVTKVDWRNVEPVDIISGGSPCQDLSLAGKRKGMTEGTRSNLWETMREGIAIIRPKYVVWENVRGALSAEAISDLEQSEGRVGVGGGPNLRAIGRVLGDLSDLGYDAEWRGLRAADVGATHNRFRVFLLAALPDAGGVGLEAGRLPGGPAAEVSEPANSKSLLQNAHLTTRGERRQPAPEQTESRRTRPDAGRRSGTPTPNASRSGRLWRENLEGEGRHSGLGGEALDYLSDGGSSRLDVAAHAESFGRPERRTESAGFEGRSDALLSSGQDWGEYGTAVRRWELVNGPAPRPTEPSGRDNAHRLSPAFVEWMMGLPSGWVTAVPGVNRNAQLKALGNGVVPQQAMAALRDMLGAFQTAEVAA